MAIDPDVMAKIEQETKERIQKVKELIALGGLMDDDGYPTERAHEIVELWHWQDQKGWFEFIKSIWAYVDWGWEEKLEPHDYKEDKMVYRYHVSTAGWSGNEGIIRAMEKNSFMWHLTWVSSRRGGHYVFEIYEMED